MAGKRGENRTVQNLVLSLGVTMVAAAGIYVFIPHDDSKDPIKTVNTRVEVDQVRRTAPYAVAAPEGLPREWRATSVSYRGQSDLGAVWHLGYLTPDKEYVGVEQSDTDRVRQYVADVTHKAKQRGGAVEVDGKKWNRYAGEKYNALVREEPGVTTVVTGTAPERDLLRMVDALEMKKGQRPSFAPQGTESASAKPAE
ncbi:DUF4245 domain-containing protein [Streptomyces buecherae]|uniref:DUF4245 domain-containing protein n=1 Tax=Streptomyces buecherae TaxID=2763006 RepID=UPI0027E0CC3E|nr:DUF4245 domain-containing protein [Streptomyces buecherae]